MATRNGATATESPAPVEHGPAPALDIAASVASEQIERGQRVYVDVPNVPRKPTADGTLATVQREQRADGSLGEYMLCEVRKSKSKDQPDSVQRYSIARIQALKDTLSAAGVTVLR